MYRYSVFFLGIVLVMMLLSSCIERYYPEEEDLQPGTLVVAAHLNSVPGVQSLQISRSVTLTNTGYTPVSGCYVELERADGLTREFPETEQGEYSCDLDQDFLQTSMEYRLNFISGEGKQYQSEFELMHPAPEIDSLRFQKEVWRTENVRVSNEGIRFYVDFEIEKDSGRYLRWDLEETYELINPDYPTRMYGTNRRWSSLLYGDKILHCWITRHVPGIYTKDMELVGGAIYYKMPLSYVSGSETRRLYEKYSLLVTQLSLSEQAFWYWSELSKNTQSGSELFSSQPALTASNICNVDDGSEIVIGYFSMAGASQKRIFVVDPPEVDIFFDPYICAPGVFPKFLWNYPQDKLPLYVARANIRGVAENGKVKDECVFCNLYKGSSDQKPDFWE